MRRPRHVNTTYHYPGIDVSLEVSRKLDVVIRRMERLMALVDDLKTAITDLTSETTRIASEIDQLITKIGAPGTSDADVQAAIDQVKGLTGQLKAASDKSDAAVP